jgi:2-oxoisovalerate ferredoxin oxidoreductase beta subunit
VPAGGTILYDSSVVSRVPGLDPRVRVLGVPFTEIAVTLGKAVVKNIVALGALQAATNLFPPETFLLAVREALKEKAKLVPLNEAAFAAGMKALAPVTM